MKRENPCRINVVHVHNNISCSYVLFFKAKVHAMLCIPARMKKKCINFHDNIIFSESEQKKNQSSMNLCVKVYLFSVVGVREIFEFVQK